MTDEPPDNGKGFDLSGVERAIERLEADGPTEFPRWWKAEQARFDELESATRPPPRWKM